MELVGAAGSARQPHCKAPDGCPAASAGPCVRAGWVLALPLAYAVGSWPACHCAPSLYRLDGPLACKLGTASRSTSLTLPRAAFWPNFWVSLILEPQSRRHTY